MAVYTHLAAEDLAALIGEYDVGELVSAKGIAEGISNSNWLIETTAGRFILTLYERRIDIADLPFFLALLDHLSDKGSPVPRTIHDRSGALSREVAGKAAALIEFLPGVSVDRPTPTQARAVGEALAGMHLASADFEGTRANALGIRDTVRTLESCGEDALAGIDPALVDAIGIGRVLAAEWPAGLPRATCHTDLFPDNVLMRGAAVTGMIDFYFACDEAMAYDLAVTHAAWSFDRTGRSFTEAVGRAIVEGYESVRPLTAAERFALPVLAQGACLRFVASRAEDWLDTPADALVIRKNPMDFMRRLQFYRSAGQGAFQS